MSAMAAGATQVTGAMQSITGISQENQASIEQVAGSSVEIKAQIDEVIAAIQIMTHIAQSLEQAAGVFQVE
jgi:methyl-accepting chemotaxis protein